MITTRPHLCLLLTTASTRSRTKLFSTFLQGKGAVVSTEQKKNSRMVLKMARAASSSTSTGSITKNTILEEHIRKIFDAGLQSVEPSVLVKNRLTLSEDGSTLFVKGGQSHTLNHNVYVVGFGKAVLGMTSAVNSLLREHIVEGVVSVPTGIQDDFTLNGKTDLLLPADSKIKVMEGAKNNLPDENSFNAASEIRNIAKNIGLNDILIVLVSGGGSALLPLPIPPITLTDKCDITKEIAGKGATINELNTVRKQLSMLKGGKLAQIAYPGKVVSLILSDIVGDPLNMIASGPTVYDKSTKQDCIDIIHRYNGWRDIPVSVKEYLHQSQLGVFDEDSEPGTQTTPSPISGETVDIDSYTDNILIGTNIRVLRAAFDQAVSLGYTATVLSSTMIGEARLVGEKYIDLVGEIANAASNLLPGGKNILDVAAELTAWEDVDMAGLREAMIECFKKKSNLCILAGGETTVTLKNEGKGGRNQELVLSAALEMHKHNTLTRLFNEGKIDVTILAAGTDGQDGPTPVAGALASPHTVKLAEDVKINPREYLERNDSYTFFNQLGKGHVVTGLTGTNVMDVHVIMIYFDYNEN